MRSWPASAPRRRRCWACGLAAFAYAAPPPRYAFAGFDVPGWTFTRGFAINHAGTIVGVVRDPAAVGHGYFWSNGVFTQFDYPHSTETVCRGINTAGVC